MWIARLIAVVKPSEDVELVDERAYAQGELGRPLASLLAFVRGSVATATRRRLLRSVAQYCRTSRSQPRAA